MKNLLILILIVISCQGSVKKDFKELALTPPMGWNSWNWFGKRSINENIVREVIDAMVNEGLRDAGYIYVVIDGGWRDNKLGSNGELLPHPEKFPNGIKPLADYAHSKGLKLGLHTVPGTHDCGGDPVGGYGNEKVHLQQFIDWGIDFIKLDKCKYYGELPDTTEAVDKNGWSESFLKDVYFKWNKLLLECDREILFSISAYVWRDWYPEICHMARTTRDIEARVGNPESTAVFDDNPYYGSIMGIMEVNNKWAEFAGNGYWNDPDMMVTGEQGLSIEEQKAHFALWSIASAPLFLGNDPRNMTQYEKDIILNKNAIRINQDPGEQGKRIHKEGNSEIWAKKLKNGDVAVLLLNRDKTESKTIKLNMNEINMPQKVFIEEIYSKKEIGPFTDSITRDVNPLSGDFLLIKKKK